MKANKTTNVSGLNYNYDTCSFQSVRELNNAEVDPRKDHQQQRQQLSNREQQHHIDKSEQEPEDTIMTNSSNHQHMCPYCNYTSSSEMRIQAHVLTAHGHSEPSPPPPARASSPVKDFLCPLCQDGFRDRAQLEVHVMQIHSVNSEGLQRLLLLVDQSHWLNAVSRSSAPSTPQSQPTPHHPQHHTPPGSNSHPHHNQMISPSSSSAGSSKELDSSGGKQNNSDVNSIEDREDHSHPDLMSPSPDDQSDADENRCQTCFKLFRNIDELCAHQNETGHLEIKQTPSGPGYLCWKKGCNQYFPTAHSLQMHFREIHSSRSSGLTQQGMAVSEKHVYKYRCNQCSLAFKTMEKLQLHSQYHLIRDATKCVLCGRSFRSVIALHKHVETSHAELTDEELAAYKQSLMNNPLLLAGFSGQVLDPSTNELLKKESLKMDSDDLIDTDESPTKDHSHNQDDGMGNSHSGDGENSDDSVVYKEQQFLEDYLNSQAIAEDSYNDPNRKYKCHRCKVAFTRQSYLTSHNKTLLHRKGEKLSYPMEKYLDPNRPYKCDTRASKLQDLAISGQIDLSKPLIEQPEPQKIQDQHKKMLQDILGTSPKQTTTSPSSGVNTSSSSVTSQVPSLAQGSPPVTGSHIVPQSSSAAAVSASTPTMTSVPSSVMPNNATTPNSSTTSHINNAQVPPVIASSPSPQHGMLSCQRCSALFANQEQLTTHQQLYCLFGSPMNIFPPLPTPTQASTQTHPSHCSPQPLGHKTPPPVSTTPHLQDDPFPRVSVGNKKPSQVYKHLLESFGFDLVMQFNENHQRRQRKEREEDNEAPPPPMPSSLTPQQPETQPEGVVVKIEVEDVPEQDLPEVAKSVCQHCRKEFSSVWVLKAHCEEVHRDLVPPEFLEKYAQQIKSEYEKKGANASGAPSAPGPVIQISTSSNTDAVPEKEPEDNKEALHAKMGLSQPQQHNHHRQATPPVRTPPAPSTPTASSTPASSTDSIPATLSTPMAVSMMGSANNVASGNPQSLSMSLAQQMNEMQAALNVMAASQLQQQLQQFNPMMMGMAGLGMGLPLGLNMNALAAMNLQPPLVPMMMPPPPFDTMSLAQAQSPLFSPQGWRHGPYIPAC
uniref:C2H2-type domain-containing protein n=1 Tax=Timema cristinae TaxID=61476 RepID=A0A7R9D0Z8_TIMCR|nr:unnamed protein product [Timema cristinae]